MTKKQLNLSDMEKKNILNDEEFYILRKKGTEPAFSGKFSTKQTWFSGITEETTIPLN